MAQPDLSQFQGLIGLTPEVAAKVCEANGYRLRVRTRDGQGMVGTADFRQDRINVAVDKGIITAIKGLG